MLSAALNTPEAIFLDWLDNWGHRFRPPYITIGTGNTHWLGGYSLQEYNNPGRSGRRLVALVFSDNEGQVIVAENPIEVLTVELTQLTAERVRVDIVPSIYVECLPVIDELLTSIARDYPESGFTTPQQRSGEVSATVNDRIPNGRPQRGDTRLRVAIAHYAVLKGEKQARACDVAGISRNTYLYYKREDLLNALIQEAEAMMHENVATLWKRRLEQYKHT